MFFLDTVSTHLQYLQRRKRQIDGQLHALPTTPLIIKHSRGKKYYYIKKYGRMHSLKDDPKAIGQHLLKKDLLREKSAIESNIPLLETLMRRYQPVDFVLQAQSAWVQRQQSDRSYRPEQKRHLYQGISYRSKSEVTIASLLTSYEIPFQYEMLLRRGDFQVSPDFAIQRPKDNKLFLWEHFGLTADPIYLQKAFQKLIRYHEAGYDLWDNLLISFDNENGDLNLDTIDKMIHLFLL